MPGFLTPLAAGLVLLALTLSGCAQFPGGGADQALSGQELTNKIYQPAGPGPFPAVIILHGCGGVSRNDHLWASRLAGWGYLAVVTDSLGPRGEKSICAAGGGWVARRAEDVMAVARYLTGLKQADPQRLALLGMSHGGATVLAALQKGRLARLEGAAIRAGVAYYPSCRGQHQDLGAPVLVLIGQNDDWTPAERCQQLEQTLGSASQLFLRVYPGAYHRFDDPSPERYVLGHRLLHDPQAAPDSYELTRTFLAGRLGPQP